MTSVQKLISTRLRAVGDDPQVIKVVAVRVRQSGRHGVNSQKKEAGDADSDVGKDVDRGFARGEPPQRECEDRQVAPVWKSTSELGYPENYCGDLCEPPRHPADAVTGTTSRRWRGTSTPLSRCSYEDNIASMAWGA